MRIGFSIAQTAALSVMGLQAVNGVRLWVSQVERKGDIRIGQQLLPVRLIIRDDCSRTSLSCLLQDPLFDTTSSAEFISDGDRHATGNRCHNFLNSPI
jgi:hypothetical protein